MKLYSNMKPDSNTDYYTTLDPHLKLISQKLKEIEKIIVSQTLGQVRIRALSNLSRAKYLINDGYEPGDLLLKIVDLIHENKLIIENKIERDEEIFKSVHSIANLVTEINKEYENFETKKKIYNRELLKRKKGDSSIILEETMRPKQISMIELLEKEKCTDEFCECSDCENCEDCIECEEYPCDITGEEILTTCVKPNLIPELFLDSQMKKMCLRPIGTKHKIESAEIKPFSRKKKYLKILQRQIRKLFTVKLKRPNFKINIISNKIKHNKIISKEKKINKKTKQNLPTSSDDKSRNSKESLFSKLIKKSRRSTVDDPWATKKKKKINIKGFNIKILKFKKKKRSIPKCMNQKTQHKEKIRQVKKIPLEVILAEEEKTDKQKIKNIMQEKSHKLMDLEILEKERLYNAEDNKKKFLNSLQSDIKIDKTSEDKIKETSLKIPVIKDIAFCPKKSEISLNKNTEIVEEIITEFDDILDNDQQQISISKPAKPTFKSLLKKFKYEREVNEKKLAKRLEISKLQEYQEDIKNKDKVTKFQDEVIEEKNQILNLQDKTTIDKDKNVKFHDEQIKSEEYISSIQDQDATFSEFHSEEVILQDDEEINVENYPKKCCPKNCDQNEISKKFEQIENTVEYGINKMIHTASEKAMNIAQRMDYKVNQQAEKKTYINKRDQTQFLATDKLSKDDIFDMQKSNRLTENKEGGKGSLTSSESDFSLQVKKIEIKRKEKLSSDETSDEIIKTKQTTIIQCDRYTMNDQKGKEFPHFNKSNYELQNLKKIVKNQLYKDIKTYSKECNVYPCRFNKKLDKEIGMLSTTDAIRESLKLLKKRDNKSKVFEKESYRVLTDAKLLLHNSNASRELDFPLKRLICKFNQEEPEEAILPVLQGMTSIIQRYKYPLL